MEAPPQPVHWLQLLDQLDLVDHLVFATDYPHWDFDAPNQAFPFKLTPQVERKIMAENARALYRLA